MRERLPGAVGFPLGLAVAVLATVAAGVLAAGHPAVTLIALVAVVDAVAMVSTAPAAVATAAACWCLHVGFALNQHGVLSFGPSAGHAAFILGVNVLGATLVASGVRSAVGPPVR